MKILIVNAYQEGSKSQKFANFERILKDIIKKEKQLIDISCDVITCDGTSINQYLYEPGLTKKENAKQFNFIDMIFIEGDANLRPWSPRARKFLMMIKMCIKSNKILFGSSFCLQAIVYLLSTNIEKPINIVNGLNGGNIKDIKKSVMNLEELKNTDLFLDNITGDLFRYDPQSKQWKPHANVGIHCRKQAQENPLPGKIIMKPEVKRQNSKHDSLVQLYVGQNTEQIVYIKKIFINHYTIVNVEHEFLASSKNSWDLHLINFPNPQLTFQILADSKFTSEMIELNENIFSTQFSISRKYPETVKILQNFIKHHMDRVQQGIPLIPIENAAYKLLDGSIGGDQPANLLDDTQVIPQPNKNCFQQMEIEQTHPNPELIQQQQLQLYQQYQDKIVNKTKDSQLSRLQTAKSNNFLLSDYPIQTVSQIGLDKGKRPFSAIRPGTGMTRPGTAISRPGTGFSRPGTAMTRPGTGLTRPGSGLQKSMSSQDNYQFNGKNYNNNSQSSMEYNNYMNGFQQSNNVNNNDQQSNTASKYYINQSQLQKETQFEDTVNDIRIMKTKTQIRQLLHPNISQAGLPEKDTIWIPGTKSCKNLGLSGVWKDQSSISRSKVVKVPSVSGKYFQSDRAKNLLEQEKLFKTLQNQKIKAKSIMRFVPDYEEAREQPQIRCGSAYVSKIEQEKLEEKKNREKELGNHVIRTGLARQIKYEPSVIAQGQYDEKNTFVGHQFRKETKKKWIVPKNFKSAV